MYAARFLSLALVCLPTATQAATVFTLDPVGATFSGAFSINTAVSADLSFVPGSYVYKCFPPLQKTMIVGNFMISIAGGIFQSSVENIIAFPNVSWNLTANGFNGFSNFLPAYFNGENIPGMQTVINLPGSAQESSNILPLPLSSYNAADPVNIFDGPSLQFAASQSDGHIGISISEVGYITTLLPTGNNT